MLESLAECLTELCARAEKIWCTFISCTKRVPNIDWRSTKYCTPTLFFMVINILNVFFSNRSETNPQRLNMVYISNKKLLLIHFASISTLMKKQSMVVILLSRPPSYGCALNILQTCVMCFAIYLVTSWNNDFNYSENEPSKCYIILCGHNKILFP